MCATQAPEPEDTRPTWLLYWLVAEWVALALSIPLWVLVAVSVTSTVRVYQIVSPDESTRDGTVAIGIVTSYPIWAGALVAGAWWCYARHAIRCAVLLSLVLTLIFAYVVLSFVSIFIR